MPEIITREPKQLPSFRTIEKEPAGPYFSENYGCTLILIPVYCVLPDGKEVFLLNRLSDVVETDKKDDAYVVMAKENDKERVEDFVNQLKAHDGKWLDRYSKWPWQPKEVRGLSPVEFVKWAQSKGYTFTYFTEVFVDGSATKFMGNLNEYSCAFGFDIIDTGMVEELKTLLPNVKTS